MRRLRLAVFVPAVAVWTYLLLEPKPVPDAVLEGISWFDWEMLHFLLAKALHLTAYAVLAVIGAPLFRPGRRWVMFAGLILHGVGTEIGQMYVPNRHGCVRDMLIDAAGVTIGAVVFPFVPSISVLQRKDGTAGRGGPADRTSRRARP